MGLLITFAPYTFVSLVNRFAAWMKWSSALVIKSDTSLLLLKARVARGRPTPSRIARA